MIRFLRQYYPIRGVILFTGETLLIFTSILLATIVRFVGADYLVTNFWIFLPKAVLIVAVCQLVFHYTDFYDLQAAGCPLKLALRLIQSLGVASIILAFIYYCAPNMVIGRGVFLIGISFIAILTYGWRFLIHLLFRIKRFSQKILIVGSGNLAKHVAREILARKDFAFKILGFVDKDPGKIGQTVLNPKIICSYDQLCDIAERHFPTTLIVAMDDRRNGFPLNELLTCKMRGMTIEDHSTFLEKLTGKLMVENLNPSHLIFSDGFKKSKIILTTRRLTEIFLSLAGLIILSPLILLVSIVIKMDSQGPVFFKQERVGENNRNFNVYKFRSMRSDAESHTGPVWAAENDPRITRVGRYIRKFRIDEIPQIWNVLKGDMSFIGPRPERPCFVEELTKMIPYYSQRHSVKPGITGWAQIKYSYGASVEDAMEKLKYDLYYIKNMSPFFDLSILFETVKIVLFGKGAR